LSCGTVHVGSRIDVLPVDDALQLLRRVIGDTRVAAEPEAAAELVELCGRLPIAVRVAAERVLARQGERISELVAELSQQRDRLDLLSEEETSAVGGVFSWSYQALKPEPARLFRLLSLHPAQRISLDAAASIAGLPVSDARRLLRTLSDGHLLEEYARYIYKYHGLLRLYASELVAAHESERDRAEAITRGLDFYLHEADRANLVIVPGLPRPDMACPVPGCHPLEFSDVDQAALWIAREQENLLAALRQAAATGDLTRAWQLVDRCRVLFETRGTLKDWFEAVTLGLESANAAADRRGQALMHNQRAMARMVGNLDITGALADLNDARQAFADVGDDLGVVRAVGNIGNVYSNALNDHESALPYFHEALAEFEALGDRDGQARALAAIAESYQHLHRDSDALSFLYRARDTFLEVGDVLEAARAQIVTADALAETGPPERALAVLLDAQQAAERLGDQVWAAVASLVRARCHNKLGSVHRCVDAFQRCAGPPRRPRLETPRPSALRARLCAPSQWRQRDGPTELARCRRPRWQRRQQRADPIDQLRTVGPGPERRA